MLKKKYFAQMSLLGEGHKARYFFTLQEARGWLLANSGGTISKRGAGVIHSCGHGRDRIHWDPPIRTWGIVEEVEAP